MIKTQRRSIRTSNLFRDGFLSGSLSSGTAEDLRLKDNSVSLISSSAVDYNNEDNEKTDDRMKEIIQKKVIEVLIRDTMKV